MICIVISSFLAIELLRKEDVVFNARDIYILSIVNALILSAASVYGIRISYVLMLIWISYIAFVDYVTCYVYDAMEYYGVLIVIMGIVDLFLYNKIESIQTVLLVRLIIVIIFAVTERAGCYGRGDTEIFAVLSVVYHNPCYIILIFGMSVGLFVLRYSGEIIGNRGKLKSQKPFIPSIYMANLLLTLHLIITSQS